ncbi:PPR domain-containing protein/PPR_2 domain-containing protein/DYW_deaminase domain-containing protein [Cephalotus follicularis]|uniref:PPR domain-containing protein/PPR_2 domain-containing protein/DYW_deaminase domain-containing protein n=1 Tax=Cephalotus follicularis TaxID=3775 RepID=A0A1Q3B139_CEPFO|nr:PPR domain-containing protein/PPR_2 domain-containing protein/DYW_deaminase domain-containing protein [Cephalotus follicularis]
MFHAHFIITNQPSKNDFLVQANSLVNLYAKCGQLSTARRLFDNMPNRNVVSYSSLMAGYLHNGFSLEVLKLFKDMVLVDNISRNEYIFANVLNSCSYNRKVEEGRQCHGYVLKSGLLFHQYVKSAIIDMYCKCSAAEEAMLLLNSVPGYDVFSYNSMLNGLLEHGYLREGLEVAERLVGECVRWDNVTYLHIFGLCASLNNLKLGLEIHCRMLKSDVECDEFIRSAIINMYGKCGKVLNARKVFDGFQTRNVVIWTAIMAAYLQNRCFEEALKLLSDMEIQGISPNEFTFAVLLNSAAGLSALRHGNVLHARAIQSGYQDYVIVGNALITMYSKGGSIEAANKVFSRMICRDTITWNAMICGYSHHGLGKEALIVFQDMLTAENYPTYVTFVGVLSACGHVGLVQEGFYFLNQLMKQFGIEPGLEHYTCVVGLLSRAGLLDKAEKFMRSTPVKWDVVAWRTLLSACHVHRNFGFGRRIAEYVLKMDPNDVGTYTLLSNMYAKAKRWDGVVKVRKLMRERNIKKEPGVSWLDIRNTTHVFVAEDNKHPEISQINEKVRELLAKIMPLGYVPDVAALIHDMEDEQKEDCLSYHSEKLAIAYGLMKTPSEAPVYVYKNLRMCDDCHSAVKFISMLTNRVLIVRDANRFHCFRDGCCTCADYW